MTSITDLVAELKTVRANLFASLSTDYNIATIGDLAIANELIQAYLQVDGLISDMG